MVNIYEMLRERSKEFSCEVLQCLIVLPDILARCYRRWLKYEDSFSEEMRGCMDECIESTLNMELGKIKVYDGKEAA